jgi:hypothetical protein
MFSDNRLQICCMQWSFVLWEYEAFKVDIWEENIQFQKVNPWITLSENFICNIGSINKNSLEVSYHVSLKIAKMCKLHITVENHIGLLLQQ